MTKHPLFAIFVLISALASRSTIADVVTFTVDPNRSSLTLSGNYVAHAGDGGSLPISASFTISQGGGGRGGAASTATEVEPASTISDSLSAPYVGTIIADQDLTHNSLQITGGTLVAKNGGNWSPTGTPADYGLYASTAARPGYDILGSLSNLAFTPSSKTITSPASFSASLLSLRAASGQLDYAITAYTDVGGTRTLEPSKQISGDFAVADGLASLTSSSGTQTLVIPIATDILFTLDTGDAFALHMSGNIVAVNPVPEPTSLIVAGVPTFLLLLRRKRT